MTARNYEFVQLDVFTRTPLTGNPLAVFTDARGLIDARALSVRGQALDRIDRRSGATEK